LRKRVSPAVSKEELARTNEDLVNARAETKLEETLNEFNVDEIASYRII
jgi:hypothetical protein